MPADLLEGDVEVELTLSVDASGDDLWSVLGRLGDPRNYALSAERVGRRERVKAEKKRWSEIAGELEKTREDICVARSVVDYATDVVAPVAKWLEKPDTTGPPLPAPPSRVASAGTAAGSGACPLSTLAAPSREAGKKLCEHAVKLGAYGSATEALAGSLPSLATRLDELGAAFTQLSLKVTKIRETIQRQENRAAELRARAKAECEERKREEDAEARRRRGGSADVTVPDPGQAHSECDAPTAEEPAAAERATAELAQLV